ncbi:MAG: DUF1641 domain-containing protein [Prolixibacteraceae bacterium]|nr:DUF1641 domain-containing protein [Prolixibacteraceae bacterium]
MDERAIQVQIAELNQKVDLLLDYVNQQRLKTGQLEDLLSDLSIVGKDVYDTAVGEFDKRMVELDLDQLKSLVFRILKNVENMNKFLEIFESINDFLADASPIFNEVIIDLSKKMDEFDRKGYFEFFSEAGRITDKVIANTSPGDLRYISENIPGILDILKEVTDPKVVNGLKNTLKAYNSIDMTDIPEYSILRAIREMNKPEIKQAMGFLITFLKSMPKSKNI